VSPRRLLVVGRRFPGDTNAALARQGPTLSLAPQEPLRGLAYLRHRAATRPPSASSHRANVDPAVQDLIDRFNPTRDLDDPAIEAEAKLYEQRRWGQMLTFVVFLQVRGWHGGWDEKP
jgi:hypothetical protein